MPKADFDREKFEYTKAKAELLYKEIGNIECPFLKKTIVFNSKGIEHIKFKSWKHPRLERDQFMRFKLLHLVPNILMQTRTLQGIKEINKLERVKMHSRWEDKMVRVTYYEFISVIQNLENNCRIRVVVKEIQGSPPFFWSIIPYWKQGKIGREMFEGNPEED